MLANSASAITITTATGGSSSSIQQAIMFPTVAPLASSPDGIYSEATFTVDGWRESGFPENFSIEMIELDFAVFGSGVLSEHWAHRRRYVG